MPRYVIEREIPGIGSSKPEDLALAVKASNKILAEMRGEKKNIEWCESFVARDKTFCIYIADNAELVEEHSRRSGFPATVVTEVKTVIDPNYGQG